MLRISKLADYGVVVMCYLVNQNGAVKSAREIAAAVHISVETASKVLKLLSECDLVSALRGAGGGYCLTRAPADISLSDVIQAVEGGMLALTECASIDNNCAVDAACTLKHNWRLINRVLLSILNELTLHDMAQPLMLGVDGKLKCVK